MNTTNEEPKKADNMELLKQQAANCGAGCACHSGGTSGKAKMLICGAVLLVAAVLVVKAVTKTGDTAATAPATGFALPVGTATAATATEPAPATGPTAIADPAAAAESTPDTGSSAPTAPAAKKVGAMIGTLMELNTVATSSDAVFVYLPGNEANTASAPTTALDAAVRAIATQGAKCAIFTLKPDSPDYAMLAPQMAIPGVLAMVKGKGMMPVSGEITETKLVQGYVAAASAGGCGSGGCGSGGCQ